VLNRGRSADGSGRRRRTSRRSAAGALGGAALAAGCAIALAAPARAAAPPASDRVDPALLAAADAAPGDSLTAWVTFADKGARDEADRRERLARAEAALTPRARARRLRAGLGTGLDESDLPLEPSYLRALEDLGLRPFAASRWLNRVAVRAPGGRVAEIAALPFVAHVSRVERARVSDGVPAGALPAPALVPRSGTYGARRSTVNDGYMAETLAQIGAPALHDSGYTGAGVLIAMLDEGFNAHETHEALAGTDIPPGYRRDFVEGDSVVTDLANPASFSHGTWTLGCIAGYRPGTYVGAAFGATFALARTEVHATETPVEMLYWAQAAEWADSLGADVISSSVGYFQFDSPYPDYTYADMNGATTDITKAARIAASKGILVVNSVGNEGASAWHYLVAPSDANGDSLIAVGAVDATGAPASFSSYGPSADGRVKPDLAARGVLCPVLSTTGGPSAYLTGASALDGTSFAAPVVAGLAACLLQARPAWRAVDVIRALRETASRAWSPDNRVGYGIPNGAAALSWQPGGSFAPGPPGDVRVLGPNPMIPGGTPVRVRFIAAGVMSGPQKGRVHVVDAGGRALRELWTGSIARGATLVVAWDGTDRDGRRAPPGIYYIALTAGGDTNAARVIALR
jgi:hypothetical protein